MNIGEHRSSGEQRPEKPKDKNSSLWGAFNSFVQVAIHGDGVTTDKDKLVAPLVPLTRFELEERLEKRAREWVETKVEAKEWLQRDIEYIEDELWNAISEVSDKTLLEQLRFENDLLMAQRQKAEQKTKHKLQCINCGHVVKMDTKAKVHVCPECKGGSFAVVHPEEVFELWVRMER